MVESSAKVNCTDTHRRQTPLYFVIERREPTDHLEIAKYLIEEGHADVNFQNEDDQTPLHKAAQYGNADIAKLLIQNGAD